MACLFVAGLFSGAIGAAPAEDEKTSCRQQLIESGEGGIRTRGGVSPTQHFQCCTFGRSVTSPDEHN